MEEKTLKIIEVSISIYTDKSFKEIEAALTKGIYVGLDSPVHQIARPIAVNINHIKEIVK